MPEPDHPPRVPRRTIQIVVAVILALLTAAGVIEITDDPAPAPKPIPTAIPRTQPHTAAGREHEDLAESGARELGRLPAGAVRSAGIRGCVTDFNQHNFSARPPGARAQLIVGHWTASRNLPGWADVNANKTWLNQPATRASANFIIDAEGNCAYTVPIDLEAWTQAQANPYAVSIEYVDTGTEGGLSNQATAKGGLVAGQVARRLGIPIRPGASTNCTPTRSGFVDHKSFGPCGGGHPDLGNWPLEPWINASKTGGTTSIDRVTCRKLNWWRNHGRPHGQAAKNAIRRRDALTARGVTCTRDGPART